MNQSMRRKDREVTEFSAILQIIDECEILRLGLADGDVPYIVPVNFAYTFDGEDLCFYIHGAMAGRKYALMRKCGVCAFEMDMPLQMECIPERRDVTMRYKSVMGKASIAFLEGEEKQNVMDKIIMHRHDMTRNFAYNRNALERTAVVRLKVMEISAKVNPVGRGADS